MTAGAGGTRGPRHRGPTGDDAAPIVLGVMLVVAALIVAGGIALVSGGSRRAEAGTDQGTASSCYGGDARPAAGLLASVLPPPAGFVAASGDGPVGPLDRAQASGLEAEPAAAEGVLGAEQFVGGARRVWEDPRFGMILDIRVYQFSCPAGAAAHLRRQVTGKLGTVAPVAAPVPGRADAVGYASTGTNQNGLFTQAGAATSGEYFFVVYAVSAARRAGAYTDSLVTEEDRLVAHIGGPPVVTGRPGDPPPAGALPAGPGSPPLCPQVPAGTTPPSFAKEFVAAPTGLVPFPPGQRGAGPVTAPALAAAAFDPAIAAAVDRAQGFEGGYVRLWYDPVNQATLVVELLRFSCGAGTSQYLAAQLPDLGIDGGRPFPVPGLVGASGVVAPRPDRYDRYAESVAAIAGTTYVNVTLFNPTTATARAVSLARAEYAAVQAGPAATAGGD